jgi:hypothetical protein
VGLRDTLRLPYAAIEDISVRGRHFGTRLIISTRGGRSVVSGIAPSHAAELTEVARRQLTAPGDGA